jgi:hypothetical protein
MARLQFTSTSNSYIKIDVADLGNTRISAPIQHINNYKRCTLLKTGEFLDSMEGRLLIYNYDEISDTKRKELKNEGHLGFLIYSKGIEAGLFTVQIYVSKEEFNRIIKMLSHGNQLTQIDIETPLHGEDLSYGTLPDSPIVWNTETNDWVHIDNCDYIIAFRQHEKH